MAATPTLTSAWGVRAVLSAFILACKLYNKHRDKCEKFLDPSVCTTLSAVCGIIDSLFSEYDSLPPVGTRGSG